MTETHEHKLAQVPSAQLIKLLVLQKAYGNAISTADAAELISHLSERDLTPAERKLFVQTQNTSSFTLKLEMAQKNTKPVQPTDMPGKKHTFLRNIASLIEVVIWIVGLVKAAMYIHLMAANDESVMPVLGIMVLEFVVFLMLLAVPRVLYLLLEIGENTRKPV
jgi:hypothetical protein